MTTDDAPLTPELRALYEQFERATTDGLFLTIEAADPKFDLHATREFLEGLHPAGVSDIAA